MAVIAATTLLAASTGLTACTGGAVATTEASTTTMLLPSTTTTSEPLPTTTVTSTTLIEVADNPSADPMPPSPGQLTPDGTVGIAIVAAGGAVLTATSSGDALVRAHEGLVMAVEARDGDWLRLFTPCDTVAWVNAAEVQFIPRKTTGGRSPLGIQIGPIPREKP